MFQTVKISNILKDLVKFGVVADFSINNEDEKYEVILYNADDAECIISNFNKIGVVTVVGEQPELLDVYFSNLGIINSIFKKYY